VPRKRPLPDIERKICERFRDFRERLELTRPQLGRRAGIEEEMLARYERELVPVRYGDVWKMNWGFGLNPSWLAEDAGGVTSNARLPIPESIGVSQKASFSEVWTAILAKEWPKICGSLSPTELLNSIAQPLGRLVGYPRRVFMERILESLLADVADCLSDDEFNALFERALTEALSIVSACNQESESYQVRCLHLDAERAKYNIAEGALDTLGLSLLNPSVPSPRTESPLWDRLLERLRNVTSRSGSKVALANSMGVTKSAVSQWLAGRAQPSAENTLHMLAWVASEEAKNKSGPGALQRPRTHGPNDQNQSNETSIRPAKRKS